MKPGCRVAAGALLVAALASGCSFSLPKDVVKLDALDACPRWDPEELTHLAKSFDHRTDTFTLECALGMLRNARPSPLDQTAAGTRICFLLADRTTGNRAKREKLASEGVRWAEISLSEGTHLNGAVHYYLAVNLGLAVRSHTTLAVKNLKRLARELEKAIKLAPEEDLGGPLRVLGMLYLMAPAWPQGIGDGDKALEQLAEAAQRYPQHPLNHIFYARALWDIEEENAKENVKLHLERGIELLRQPTWGSARDRWLKELREVAEDAEIPIEIPPW